jgi:hypothetical protein
MHQIDLAADPSTGTLTQSRSHRRPLTATFSPTSRRLGSCVIGGVLQSVAVLRGRRRSVSQEAFGGYSGGFRRGSTFGCGGGLWCGCGGGLWCGCGLRFWRRDGSSAKRNVEHSRRLPLLIPKLESKLILPIALVAADVRCSITPKDAVLLGWWRRWQVDALFLQEFVHFLCKKLIKLVQLLASLPDRLKRVSLFSLECLQCYRPPA